MTARGTKIEDYAFLSDTQTGALVSRDGCVDWLCFPRFDSPACFASLLGARENGRWFFHPDEEVERTRRRYRDETLVLETEIETKSGAVRLIDFMPPRGENPDIIRIVEGLRGKMSMHMELIIRFDYGQIVPWVRKRHDGLEAIAGPDGLILRTPIETCGKDLTTVAEFSVAKGDRVPFVLTWFASHAKPPRKVNAEHALRDTEKYWRDWSSQFQSKGEWRDAVMRSLITLKGLTYAPTGGLVAALTTSLPEEIGGVRNWDYRFCWLRDAALILLALLRSGYREEAKSWRQWLLRAIAGSPAQMQAIYGVRGERRLEEFEIPWLSGYEKSKPVRIGNAASNQFQLDVYGEILAAIWQADRAGLKLEEPDWALMVALMKFLESNWHKPDEGIWEVRGGRKHFTHWRSNWLRNVAARQTNTSVAGKSFAIRFTRKCANAGTTPARKRSRSFTALMRSMRVCLRCRSPAFYQRLTSVSAAPSRPSNASLCRRASCFAIGPRKKMSMDCRAAKAFFCRAHSGWPIVCISSTERKKRGNYSSACSMSEMISDCFPKNTIRVRNVSSGIFPKHFHT